MQIIEIMLIVLLILCIVQLRINYIKYLKILKPYTFNGEIKKYIFTYHEKLFYEELRKINDRYCFTIDNYVMGLIEEVKNSDFAYISNVCVSPLYRGKHVGNRLMNYVIDVYVDKYFKEIALDVLAQNPSAVKLYENLGFEQISELFKGFSDPKIVKPDVFSMKLSLEKYSDKNNN